MAAQHAVTNMWQILTGLVNASNRSFECTRLFCPDFSLHFVVLDKIENFVLILFLSLRQH